ncbi:hypothetical protein [Thermoactinospora rubra]|uniref:hypothetical protein n=1 Tax=Thermoactinospora rubra TaxID=1088767 RepID=UPI000A0F620E|nr:hypothetical protein [Thermoactinospora rubra]
MSDQYTDRMVGDEALAEELEQELLGDLDDRGGCEDCFCCPFGGCGGPNSQCPTDSIGDSSCPCTCP